MALRNQPYLPLYVQDFLTDEKLMECSASATGVYIRLLCVMHKSENYGTILLKQKDKQNDKQVLNFAYKVAKFLPYDLQTIVSGIEELLSENVLKIDGDYLIQKRMVKDGDISDKRSSAGSKGGKKTTIKHKNFAQANSQANSESESEDDIEVKDVIKNEADKKISEIVENFHLICINLSILEKITEARKKAIRARLKEYSFEKIVDVFYKVAESDYLSGRKPNSTWKATFDWIFVPDNFIKILEDNYKNLGKKESEEVGFDING